MTKHYRLMELHRMANQGYKIESIIVRAYVMCGNKPTADNLMDEFYRRIQKAIHEKRGFING